MSGRRLVVITRPAEEAERTRAVLIEQGYDVLVEPLLTIEPIPDAQARLGDPDGIAALLFTSINGVRAFAQASPRRDLPVYAVGPTTAEAALGAGFPTVRTAAGDVQALVALVASDRQPSQGALLHPAGESVAGDLSGDLAALGYDVRRIALYRAQPARALSEELRDTLARDKADAVAFFSPRTARTFVTLARTAGLDEHCRGLVAACLSPAVADAAGVLTWRQIAVADTPTQAALIDALTSVGAKETEHSGMAEDKKDEATPSEPAPAEPTPAEPTPAEPTGGAAAEPSAPASSAEAAPAASIALPAADVIQRFGGIRPMAGKMNISFSTVQGWKERNHLPPARHAEIIALAARHGVSLEPGAAQAQPEAAPQEQPTRPPSAEPTSTSIASAPPAAEPATARAEPPGFDDKPPPLPPPLPPQTVPAPTTGIGVLGAASVSIVVVAVAMLGAYATRSMWNPVWNAGRNAGGASAPVAAAANDLSQRLAKLERDVASRPAAAPDPKLARDFAAVEQNVAAIGQNVAAIGQNVAAFGKKAVELETTLVKKTAELEAALAAARSGSAAAADQAKALAPRLEALEKGFDLQAFLAVRNGLSELGGKLDGLAKRMEAAERVATAARAQGLAEAALALSVAQVRHAIDAGAPFAAELAACRGAAAGDAKAIAAIDALAPHAGAGVSTRAALSDEFGDAARAIAQAALKRSQSGWLRTLVDRLDSLVTVRPVGPDVVGDDPRARAARAETLLDRGDLAGAVRVLGGLADRPAEAAKPWLDKAKARLVAEGAIASLESQAMAGLAQRAAQVQPAGARPAGAQPAGATPKPAGATPKPAGATPKPAGATQ